MSVPMSERHASGVQFLDTALKLRTYTIAQCKKMYKKDKKFCGDKLDNLSSIILSEVKSGNSVYPLNKYEAQMRRNCFIRAYNALQSFSSELSVLLTIQPELVKAGKQWSEYVTEEMSLIKGVMKSDRKRYKDLSDEINPYLMILLKSFMEQLSSEVLLDKKLDNKVLSNISGIL